MKDTLKVTTPTDREVVITRVFDAPRALIFDCHTKPELVRRWLLGPPGWTMPVCEIDLRVGGRYRYVWRHADGREMGMGGVMREIVVPERLVQTELFDEDWTGGETVATLVLTEKVGRTTLTNTVVYSTREARDGALRTGMTDGMEAGYARLDELAAGMANDTFQKE
ncbi:MAG TPA: SRPBCC family protein [Gemmataceae bacterium]|nr:SRPBCC family protein [Gemmataceae bacterium]